MKLRAPYILLGATAAIWSGCGSRSDLEPPPTAGELALASAGSHLDGSGPCATLGQLDGVCPPDLPWDNHGQYVSCVSRYLDARVAAGDINEEQKGELVSEAAHSSVGKKEGKGSRGSGFEGCDPMPDNDDADAGVGGAPSIDDDGDDDDDGDAGVGGAAGLDDDDDLDGVGGVGGEDENAAGSSGAGDSSGGWQH